MIRVTKQKVTILGSVAALALSLGGGIVQAAPTAKVGVGQLGLRLSDLPKTFVLVKAQGENAAQAGSSNGMTAAQLRTAGFVGGYLSEYEAKALQQGKGSVARGLILALSGVLQFKQSTGAHTAFAEAAKAVPKTKGLTNFKPMSFSQVGSESQGWSYHASAGGIALTFDLILFREHNYLSLILGGGRAMTLGKEDSAVANLATIVDGRIHANT